MRNPRPPGQPGPPPQNPVPSSAAGPSPRKPPPSTPPAPAVSSSAASTGPPVQKPPPQKHPAGTATPPKPPPSRKSKSRWESPSRAGPSPQANRNDLDAYAKGGPVSASPSAGTIQRDQRVATGPAAAAAAAAAAATRSPLAQHPHSQFSAPERAAVSLPPPPPPYGFQNLERRTIVLVDGTVRTYFALPPEEPLPDPYGPDMRFRPLPPAPFPPHSNQFSPERFREPPFGNRPPGYLPPFDGPSAGKRKYSEEDELARQRMHVLQYGNPNSDPNVLPPGQRDRHLGRDERDNLRGSKHARIREYGYDDVHGNRKSQPDDVDKQAIKKTFLKLLKMIYEDSNLKKRYLDTRKNGPPLHCIACGRASKDYPDVHGLVMHSYNFSHSPDLLIDHLGFHKALCVLMGWNYGMAPDNNKAYQRLSPEEAQANREDLILWPPSVIIHNTNFGKRPGGRIEGFGNKEMDNILRDLGFPGGKARSIYDREGHTGVTIVQFAKTESGLREAEQLVNYFATQNHDRKGWTCAQPTRLNGDDDRNPLLVKMDDRTGEKKRIFYGYMATVSDIDVVEMDTMKHASLKSRREFDLSD